MPTKIYQRMIADQLPPAPVSFPLVTTGIDSAFDTGSTFPAVSFDYISGTSAVVVPTFEMYNFRINQTGDYIISYYHGGCAPNNGSY